MTPKDQQIAIALACGYRWYWTTNGLNEDGSAFKWRANLCYPPEEGVGKAWLGCAGETREMTEEEIAEVTCTRAFYTSAPRYRESLDAMHEAEKTLTEEQLTGFEDILGSFIWSGYPASTRNWHVNAAQRAEAFLRAKGWWVEDRV